MKKPREEPSSQEVQGASHRPRQAYKRSRANRPRSAQAISWVPDTTPPKPPAPPGKPPVLAYQHPGQTPKKEPLEPLIHQTVQGQRYRLVRYCNRHNPRHKAWHVEVEHQGVWNRLAPTQPPLAWNKAQRRLTAYAQQLQETNPTTAVQRALRKINRALWNPSAPKEQTVRLPVGDPL